MSAQANCARPILSMSPMDTIIQKYVFPFQFAVMAASVSILSYRLWRNQVRNVGRMTICLLGIVQVLVFLSCLPHSLGAYKPFYGSESFRRFYYSSVMPNIGMSNLLSALDSFLTVLACYEFYSFAADNAAKKFFATPRRLAFVYIAMVALAFILTSFAFFQHTVKTYFVCNGEVLRIRFEPTLPIALVRLFQLIQALFVVVIPAILVALINRRLSNAITYQTLPTECKELIDTNQSSQSVYRLRFNILLLSCFFVIPHVSSLVPFVAEHSYVSRYLLSFVIPISTSVLLWGKLLSFLLLHRVSSLLASHGILQTL